MKVVGTPRHIVVVGGGAAGALFVHHLLGRATCPLAITIVEPRARLGAGTAYSATDRLHTTNIPAARMSIDPDDPEAFLRWLAASGEAPGGDERDAYPPRWLFGDFMGQVLQDSRRSRPDIQVTHHRSIATQLHRGPEGFALLTDRGMLQADAVALATGNPKPLLPGPLRALAGRKGCITDPWAEDALAQVPFEARVLIVGTGLTMGDAVVTLRAGGHRGEVMAVSRRGRLPQRGLVEAVSAFGDFQSPPQTAKALLRQFRADVRRAEAAGLTWHSVLAAARAQGWALWGALPPDERRRFIRHLRLLYETHRHVMPGPVVDRLDDERRRGLLTVQAARLAKVIPTHDGFDVDLVPRGTRLTRRERFDTIVNCTGPNHGRLVEDDPFWSAVAAAGLVRQDALGLGIDTDGCGRALDPRGEPAPDLFVLGTLARAAYGELTGIREIAAQTRLAADTLLSRWPADRQFSHRHPMTETVP